jgi:hypothetical protein
MSAENGLAYDPKNLNFTALLLRQNKSNE